MKTVWIGRNATLLLYSLSQIKQTKRQQYKKKLDTDLESNSVETLRASSCPIPNKLLHQNSEENCS